MAEQIHISQKRTTHVFHEKEDIDGFISYLWVSGQNRSDGSVGRA